MEHCDEVEKPLLERIQSELEADPDLCDVTFSVGPQKTKVTALKVILWAASPVLKNEFKTKWENVFVRDEAGIPLAEFDGESFQLFVKLTSLDTWSEECLQKLNLAPNQLLNLLSICRRYEMRTAVKTLEKLTAAFFGLDENARLKFDVRSLAFTSKKRNAAVSSKKVSNSAELQPQQGQTPAADAAAQSFEVNLSPCAQPKETPTAKPRGCSTLSLLNDSRKINAKTPFVCDGRIQSHKFKSAQNLAVVGLGFAGPIDADAIYNVTVEMKNTFGESLTDGRLKKRIYAKKDKTFYFIFDKPITMEATSLNFLVFFKWINYSLTGPDTSSIVGGQNDWTTLQEGSTRFDLIFRSKQLSEILFNKL